MTLQICVKCKNKAMTWYETGEEGKEETWWYCSECDLQIKEDVSKECWCGICNASTVSWMIDDEGGYFWCFGCNQKTDKTLYQENFRELMIQSMEKVIAELSLRDQEDDGD